MEEGKRKKNFVEVFMTGANKGWTMGVKNMFPAVIFAYVLIIIMEQLKLLDLIAVVFDPVMAVFGLPGVAITCIATGIMTRPAGVATGLTLISSGMLTARDLTILVVPIMLVGGCIGQFVRVVIVSGVDAKAQKWILLIDFVVAFVSMWIMNLLLTIIGI